MADYTLRGVLMIVNLIFVAGTFVMVYAVIRVRRERHESVRKAMAVALLLAAVALVAAVANAFVTFRS